MLVNRAEFIIFMLSRVPLGPGKSSSIKDALNSSNWIIKIEIFIVYLARTATAGY